MADTKHTATFLFALGDRVTVQTSGEEGLVSARCEDLRLTEKRYLVEYTDNNGCATEAWFYEDQLGLTHA